MLRRIRKIHVSKLLRNIEDGFAVRRNRSCRSSKDVGGSVLKPGSQRAPTQGSHSLRQLRANSVIVEPGAFSFHVSIDNPGFHEALQEHGFCHIDLFRGSTGAASFRIFSPANQSDARIKRDILGLINVGRCQQQYPLTKRVAPKIGLSRSSKSFARA